MRRHIYRALASAAFGRPWLVFGAALALTVLAGGASETLKMETRVLDLLPSDDPAAIEFNEIVRQYSSTSQIIVGIKGRDRDQMIAFAEKLKQRIGEAKYTNKKGERLPFVKRITVRADIDFIAEHGLMLVKKKDLENLDELYQDLDLAPLLAAYNDFLEREYVEDAGSVTEREKEDGAISSLKGMMQWLEGVALASKSKGDEKALDAHAEQVADLLSVGNPYLFSDDDTMLLALVLPTISLDLMDEIMDGAKSLRELTRDIGKDYPDLTVRMTGMPVMGLEETEVTMDDMGISSVVSLVLVLALFIVAFRIWTAPLLAAITLLMGITWTTGFIAVTFGRLNLFTLMFAIILIGLGIDFSIHLNAAYSTARGEGKALREALSEMYRRAGNGVITGAITTSAAFFALALTGLDAFVELGVVLGGGIIFTMIASMTVLPAMYVIHYRLAERLARGKPRKPKAMRLAFPVLAALGRQIQQRPWPVLALSLLATAGLIWVARGAEFEPDMLEIEPPDMPSVLLHREVLKRFELHPDFSMVTSESLEQTRPIAKKLKKNRLVGRVDALTEFVPSDKEHKRRSPIVKRIGDRMRKMGQTRVVVGLPGGAPIVQLPDDNAPEKVPDEQVELFLDELDRLQMNVQEIGTLAYTSLKMRLQRFCDQLSGGENQTASRILALKKELAAHKDLARAMAEYQRAYVPRLAQKLERMASTTPITVETLPDEIKDRYLSAEGKNLITVYSSVDLWHEDKLDLFLAAMNKISDRVTGTVVLMDRLIDLVTEEGLMAIILAFCAVVVILFIDFRHPGYVLLGTVPLLLGFAWMMGLFVLVGKKFDVANVMALPLILGIGIDDAVHVLHAVKRLGAKALPEVLRDTGRALVLTTLTTAIAFGSISFSSHRGMAGMGILLVLGVCSCLVTSLVILPALMRIFFRQEASNRKDTNTEASHVS